MFKFSDSCSLVHYNPTLLISRSSRKRLLVMTAQTLQEGQDAFGSWRKTVGCFCFVILQKDSVSIHEIWCWKKAQLYIYFLIFSSTLHLPCAVRQMVPHALFVCISAGALYFLLSSFLCSFFSFLCSSFSLFTIIICCIGCAVCTSGGCAYLSGTLWKHMVSGQHVSISLNFKLNIGYTPGRYPSYLQYKKFNF